MKKDAYYFSHDSNAKDDPKCVMLIDQLGLEGYGIYWVLVETLRDQPEYKYPINLLPALSRRFNTTHEKVKAVVLSYGLFEIEGDQFFYSRSLNERMSALIENRERRTEQSRLAALKRWKGEEKPLKNDAKTMPEQCPSNSTALLFDASKEEESKEEESKVKESKVVCTNVLFPEYSGECEFKEFWDLYGKKIGNRHKCQKKWENIKLAERKQIISFIPIFKTQFTDIQYQPYPDTFLNQKRWLDEIVIPLNVSIVEPSRTPQQPKRDYTRESDFN